MKRLTFLLFLLLFSGCGKKQKHLFDFSKKQVISKVNVFDLGIIKGIKVKKTKEGNFLTWNNFEIPEKYKDNFLGFNIYRLVRASLIPKKSLNKNPINQNFFLDKEVLFLTSDLKLEFYCYIIKSVFMIDRRVIFGLVSQVACTKN